MPTPTYDLLASSSPASGVSSVIFSSLDTLGAGYRDLVLVADMVGNGQPIDIRLNANNSTVYGFVRMTGTGSVTESDSSSNATAFRLNSYSLFSGQRGLHTLTLFDFSQTDKHKVGLLRYSSADREVMARALRWANTAAITSISVLYNEGGTNFPAGCVLNLYGIKA